MIFNNNPHLLVKPEIVFGNYFFIWDVNSPGLYSNEIGKFKIFIKNMIPYLEMIMKQMINLAGTTGSRGNSNLKNDIKKVISEKGNYTLSSKYDNHIFFILNIDKEGHTTFFREEKILFDENIYNMFGPNNSFLNKLQEGNTNLSLKWKLGNLMFDRRI